MNSIKEIKKIKKIKEYQGDQYIYMSYERTGPGALACRHSAYSQREGCLTMAAVGRCDILHIIT
jgi:hypothetical protein